MVMLSFLWVFILVCSYAALLENFQIKNYYIVLWIQDVQCSQHFDCTDTQLTQCAQICWVLFYEYSQIGQMFSYSNEKIISTLFLKSCRRCTKFSFLFFFRKVLQSHSTYRNTTKMQPKTKIHREKNQKKEAKKNMYEN